MPRVTKKPKDRRLVGIRPRETTFLLNGQDTRGRPPFGRPKGQRFDPWAAWTENQDALLEYWIQDPEGWEPAWWMQPRPPGPGHRPWAWWRFEAREPRRMIRDGQAVEWIRESWGEGAREIWEGSRIGFLFGRPSSCLCYPTFSETEWESEADYLERLGLLTDRETQQLKS